MVLLSRPATIATVALSGQYGFTRGVVDDGDRHHRLAGHLALALHPAESLSLGLSMNGWRDAHRSNSGADDSIVGDSGAFVLLRLAHAGVFRLGVGAELWAPGGDHPGIVARALSPSATLYGQVNFASVVLAARVGYLVDRSTRTVGPNRVYAPGDQVSLGVTSADALQVGVGGTARVGPVDLYGDVALDVLVRRRDVPLAASRATATLGCMTALGQRVHAGVEATVFLGRYPTLRADAPYRVEPRLTAGLTLAVDLGRLRTEAPQASVEEVATPPDHDGDAVPEVIPVDVHVRVLRGRVEAEPGALGRARIRVLSDGHVVAETATDDSGVYELTGLPDGALTLVVEAEGGAVSRIELGADAEGELEPIAPQVALPGGEIRGSVHALGGSPVSASLVLDATGQAFQADADGLFSVAVSPGSHVLHIEAPGYRPQDRHVDVEESGVVVIEIHLRPQ